MSLEAFRLEDVDGVRVVRCDALERVPGVAHGFSTRIAFGGAEFDLGSGEAALTDVATRRRTFLRAAGLASERATDLRQVHGDRIVDATTAASDPSEADGAIASPRGSATVAPAVRTADCVAILIAERSGEAVAAVHSGWRGTAAGIAAQAVARFGARGISPSGLVVALGPSIGGCCYEVGAEVVRALERVSGPIRGFARSVGAGLATVDLRAAITYQLEAAGVPSKAIHRAPWCTRCRNDLFFSVRAEGPAAGRLIAVIGRSRRP